MKTYFFEFKKDIFCPKMTFCLQNSNFWIQTAHFWTNPTATIKNKVTSDDVTYHFLVIYVRLVDSDVLELCPMYLYEVM